MLADEIEAALLPEADPVLRTAHTMLGVAVRRSHKFVLSRETVGMVAALGLGRPSTLRDALPFVRLPFPVTWIEFARSDLADAMTDLGFVDAAADRIPWKRHGYLVYQSPSEPSVLTITPVHLGHDGQVWPSPLSAHYDLGATLGEFTRHVSPQTLDEMVAATRPTAAGTNFLEIMDRNLRKPAEREALLEIHARSLVLGTHFYVGAMEAHGLPCPTPQDLGLPDDVFRKAMVAASNAATYVPRILMILSLRNGLEYRDVPAPERLNRARARRGRPPLYDHKLVCIRPPRGMERAASGRETGELDALRRHWVRGHLKVRRNGIFWWSHHLRGDLDAGYASKSYLL